MNTLPDFSNLPIPINNIKKRQRIPMSFNIQRKHFLISALPLESSGILKRKIKIPKRSIPQGPPRSTSSYRCSITPRQANRPTIRPRPFPMQFEERQPRLIAELPTRAIGVFATGHRELWRSILFGDLICDGGVGTAEWSEDEGCLCARYVLVAEGDFAVR